MGQFALRPKQRAMSSQQPTQTDSNRYLSWAINSTPTCWWHDSAEPSEVTAALSNGAVGVTTNPVLCNGALSKNREHWESPIRDILDQKLEGEAKVEALMKVVTLPASQLFLPEFQKSEGRRGYVCAQVNPGKVADREAMLAAARRLAAWAPNIAVKLPATKAGLDVMKTCVAEGITVTVTVSFTLPQLIAIGEYHCEAQGLAKAKGVTPGRCQAVIMIGRLDDYLREVVQDRQLDIGESDLRQAGLAVTKRAYHLFRERGYEAELLVAALRGPYHMTELVGADLIMSISQPYQAALFSPELPKEERIENPIPDEVLYRLCSLPEFRKAYEPDGMGVEEFLTFGATQKTLSQFLESWKGIQSIANR